MWSTEQGARGRKSAAFAGYYSEQELKEKNGKLSRAMAMLLGAIVTVEIMVAGAMIFNIDFHGADGIALVFAFMVLYFGVVAVLTDR